MRSCLQPVDAEFSSFAINRVDAEPLIYCMLRTFGIVEIDFGSVHRREALEAFHRFGKGRHPAALSFGDCISYATARVAGSSCTLATISPRPTLRRPATRR